MCGWAGIGREQGRYRAVAGWGQGSCSVGVGLWQGKCRAVCDMAGVGLWWGRRRDVTDL